MDNQFEMMKDDLYNQITDHAKMVLATSYHDKVSARMMSFIVHDGHFYFQTDMNFRKYYDIKNNSNVALCLDNIQIEGICEELGCPLDNQLFCEMFKKYFLSSFLAYSSLKSEKLFVIKPTFIQRWCYINKEPMIERFYIKEKKYTEKRYNEIYSS